MLLEESHSVGLTLSPKSAGPVPHAAGSIRLASPLTSEAVRRAVAQPPAPHRYVNNVPVWMVLAARRVIEVYRATRDTSGTTTPTARELQQRFDRS
jgi:hypothetical protein